MDPNTYEGPGSSGTQHAFVNVAAGGPGQADNTGATGCAAVLNAAWPAVAASGQGSWMPAGTYSVDSGVTIPSNFSLLATPKTTIQSSVATTAWVFQNFGVLLNTGSLAATPAVGANPQTFSVTMGTAPVIGNFLRIVQSGINPGAASYKITNVAGAGPYTVTVDRPNVWGFVGGAIVYLLSSVLQNTDLDFNGAVTTGLFGSPTGGEIIEVTTAVQFRVRGLFFSYNGVMTPNASIVGFDVGCRECLLEDFNFYMPGNQLNGIFGWYAQSTERCLIQRGYVNGAQVGGELFDCYATDVVDFWCDDVGSGLSIGQFSAGSFGSNQCNVRGGGCVNAGTIGLSVFASQNISVIGWASSYCGTNGIEVNGVSNNCSFTGCTSTNNSAAGIYITGGTLNTLVVQGGFQNNNQGAAVEAGCTATFIGCDFSNNVTGIAVLGTVTRLYGCSANTTTNAAIVQTAGGLLEVEGFEATSNTANPSPIISVSGGTSSTLKSLTLTQNGTGYGISWANSGQLLVDSAFIALGNAGGGRGMNLAGGTSTNRNVHVTGGVGLGIFVNGGTHRFNGCTAAASIGLEVFAGTAIVDPDCDFSASTTPIQVQAGATLILLQQDGITIANATAALTIAQLQNSTIESSGNAAGAVTITASLLVSGMQWTCRNNNTSSSTTSFFGITVAVGKTAIIRINLAGAGERVTADT